MSFENLSVNVLDIGIIIVVLGCALIGYRRGLIRTVYGLVSFFVAMLLANRLYPYVANFLNGTRLYTVIQESIKSSLGIGDMVTEIAVERQEEVIEALRLPVKIRELLLERFNPDIHGILRVDTIEENISAFFANMATNGIALVLVFIIVVILMYLIGFLVDIVGKLPIISTFNNVGGFIFGGLLGAGISWLIVLALSLFITTPEVMEQLNGSFVVGNFFDSILSRLTVV
ncbi:MAG: CvpA family protein [Defluviitaleaceae bacterium]|nr:CvpA family protein [Defluviitaleaceae bacterium]